MKLILYLFTLSFIFFACEQTQELEQKVMTSPQKLTMTLDCEEPYKEVSGICQLGEREALQIHYLNLLNICFSSGNTINPGLSIEYLTNLINLDKHTVTYKNNYENLIGFKEHLDKFSNCPKIESCADFYQCINTKVDQTKSCNQDSFEEYCENNAHVSCHNNQVIKKSCGDKAGCATIPNYGTACINNYKVIECEPESFRSYCSKTQDLTYCSSKNKIITEACPSGSICDEIKESGKQFAICTPNNFNEPVEICNPYQFKDKCESISEKSYLNSCFHGVVKQRDCEEFAGKNFTCQKDNPFKFSLNLCVHEKTEAENTYSVHCENNQLIYKVHGENRAFNCLEYGYSACEEKNNHAYCIF